MSNLISLPFDPSKLSCQLPVWDTLLIKSSFPPRLTVFRYMDMNFCVAVPTFIRQSNRESEEESDTHEDGPKHPASKLQGIVATGAQNTQKISTRLSVHQNGYRITELDDGDWNTKPSVRLSLANATDKSEKDKVKEEFFVPLESKAIRRIGTHMPMSSRSPPVDKVWSKTSSLTST